MSSPPIIAQQDRSTDAGPNVATQRADHRAQALTKRLLSARLIHGLKRIGITPRGALIRELLPMLMAETALVDDDALCDWLMRQAPGSLPRAGLRASDPRRDGIRQR